jgi:TonB-dependent starch-binding outer membrane protein SusC
MGSRTRSALSALAVVAALCALAVPGMAQGATGTIRGKVVEGGSLRPLGGVQVSIVGTPRGALTNASGDFLLVGVPAGPQQVRAHFIGFTPSVQEIRVVAEETVRADFQLNQAAIALDEVVVTGTAGVTQRRSLGNAVDAINASAVTEKAPVSNVTQLLQGRSPGLTIMQPAGTAGTASNFRIRGTGSIYAGSHPVFYVDGVRIQSSTQGGFSVSGQSTSALNAINPDDIESIEVIKGPAAATLYGADAASGVVQIITKKGRQGQQGTQWNAKVEMGQTNWAVPIRDNWTTCTPARIRTSGSGTAASFPGCAGIDSLAPIEQRIITYNPLRDEGVLRNGAQANYMLSVRGGGDRYSFYGSADRETEEGIFVNNWFNRTSGRGNFVVYPTDKLDLTTSVQYSRTDTRLPLNDNASNGWLRNAYRGRPGQKGNFAEGWLGLGPEEMAIYNNQERAERFIFGITGNYRPFDWFQNRVTLGMDAGTRLHTLFYPIDRSGKSPYGVTNALGYISQYAPQTRNYTIDYTGTVTNDLTRNISSAFSFGMNLNMYRFESLQGVGEGLIADNVRTISTANVTRAFETFSEQNSLGFYVQEQLGWQNRLFLTGAVRVDDNSAFGSNFSTVVYPKLSGAWVISEEPFFNVANIDNLRLRAAWGQAGNAPSPFSADQTYAASTVVLDDGSLAPALRASAFGNPDLRAERGSEIEVGFEGSLFNNRAGVDVTYYNKNTYDALVRVNVAPSSGFGGSTDQNIGTINNQGLEVAVFGTPILTPNVSWDTRLGFSTNQNELVSFGGGRDVFIPVGYRSSQRHDEGYPLAGYWAERIQYNADGSLKVDPVTGRPDLGEFYYVGPSAPTREASLTNTFTLFRNFQIYTFADYKGGHYLLNMTEGTRAGDGNSWVMNDPNATAEDRLIAQFGGNAPYIEPADFVKLREISVTYNMPHAWTQRFGADGMSLSLGARNLATWTKYSQPDPEVNINGADTFTRGDSNSVPALRRVVATLNVRF